MKVLIDTDAGVDDALAILTVLADPSAEPIGVGTVFGNCDEQQAASNVLATLEVADAPPIPVCVGESKSGSLASSPHGRDGLGDRGYRPRRFEISSESAVDQLLRIPWEHEGTVHLLCLGPLTNVAAALARDSEVLSRFASVTVMGGMGLEADREAVLEDYPQFLVKGDTNTNHDPAASAAVAGAVGNVTWVGMNVTAQLRVPVKSLESSGSRIGDFVRNITADYSRYCTSMYDADEPIFTAHDVVAASVLLRPEILLASATAEPVVRIAEDGRATLWGDPVTDGVTHRFARALRACEWPASPGTPV